MSKLEKLEVVMTQREKEVHVHIVLLHCVHACTHAYSDRFSRWPFLTPQGELMVVKEKEKRCVHGSSK